jgi:cation transport ATPase
MGPEREMDDGSNRSSSSVYVEMSTLKQTVIQDDGGLDALESVSKPATAEDILSSPEALSHSTLPAASPTAHHENVEDSQHQHSEYESTQAQHMIRTVMTVLLGLLVAGILCTFLLVPQYAVLLALLWTLLISLFAGLAWFVQNAILKDRSTVLHPYLHAAAAAVMAECQLFSQDWREEVLMLTNEAEHPDKKVDASARSGTFAIQLPKRKGKSRMFRLVVRPFLPMMSRRRQKRKVQEDANQPASGYVPPEMDLA